MKIARILLIFTLITGFIGISGCVSRRSKILARLMEEMDSDLGSSKFSGPDAPEAPVSGLPPAVPSKGVGEPKAIGAATQSELTIQPECIVRVTVEEDESLDGSYPVNEIGAIDFGRIGPVFLQNNTESQASAKIQERLMRRDFRKATVTVEIIRASYDKVRVSGAVNRAGLIPIGAGASISLNDALRRASGLRSTAKGTKVKIVRDGQLFAIPSALDGEEYFLVTQDGKPSVPDVYLKNNDIAFVFPSMKRGVTGGVGQRTVLVFGEVRKKGAYSFSGTETCTIMYLVLKMGGLPPYADGRKIIIKRRDKDGNEEKIKVNAEKVMEDGNPEADFPLEDGDRVIIPARGFRFF